MALAPCSLPPAFYSHTLRLNIRAPSRRQVLISNSSTSNTSHCLALKKVCGPTGGPSAGGTTILRCPPGRIPLSPSSKPANAYGSQRGTRLNFCAQPCDYCRQPQMLTVSLILAGDTGDRSMADGCTHRQHGRTECQRSTHVHLNSLATGQLCNSSLYVPASHTLHWRLSIPGIMPRTPSCDSALRPCRYVESMRFPDSLYAVYANVTCCPSSGRGPSPTLKSL